MQHNPLSVDYSEVENLILLDKILEGDARALEALISLH